MNWLDNKIIDDDLGYPDLKIVTIPKFPPEIQVPNHEWGIAFEAIWEHIGYNTMAPIGMFKSVWHRPGPIWRGQWLWDNAFHSKVWSLANLDFARYCLDYHMSFQDRNPDNEYTFGKVPQSVYVDRVTEAWTQPPLMAWAYWELFKKNGSLNMLEESFTPLFDYHRWLNYNRDLNKDGLYSWMHGFESGIDNAPRYDDISPMECNAIDFSACVSVQLRSLINMATVLKDNVTKESLETRKRELDEWINEDLWNDEVGFYYDKAMEGDRKGEFVGPKMISGWYPLFAGIVPRDRLVRYLEHLTNPDEFWTPMPVPSVALDEPTFSRDMNMWRGPVWINTNYMIIKGLKGYGLRELPGVLAHMTVSEVFKVFDKFEIFYEYYSSLGNNDEIETFARKGEKNGPRPYFNGWTSLVANILLEDLLGLEAQHDAVLINPSAPEKFIKALDGEVITGILPRVSGWDQDKIEFVMNFKSKSQVEYKFSLSSPMDIHVVDFYTREKIFEGEKIKTIEIEVKNNADTVAILSKPEGQVKKEEF
ncbi:MAG: trehalase family glycosidase [Candidatus Hodarchaeota archaeon]